MGFRNPLASVRRAVDHGVYANLEQALDPGPDFAMNLLARRCVRPKRVRFTTDCMFASGCFPPHLTVTQLPSATGSGHLPEEDLHLPNRACLRAHRSPPARV